MRNWNQPGNIKDFVTRINALRHTNPALHHFHNLRFLPADSDQIRFYTKASSDGCNVLVVAVNLDPFRRQPCTLDRSARCQQALRPASATV